VKLTVLGSGTGWMRLDRSAPGYLVEYEGFNLILDCGPGVFKQFLRLGKSIDEVDGIFVSHYHPDHVADVIPFFFAIRYEMGYKREKPFLFVTSSLFEEFFSHLKRAFNQWVEPPEGKVTWCYVKDKEEFSLGPFRAKTRKVKHNPESLAIRLEAGGKVLVYTGDTGFCEEVIEISKGADLLLIECSNSTDVKVEHHLGPYEVADIAERAKVKRVVVTHLYPHSETEDLEGILRKHFSGDVILAKDYLSIEL